MEGVRLDPSREAALGALIAPEGPVPRQTVRALLLLYALLTDILTDETFPLPTAGLVHAAQEWTLAAPLSGGMAYTLEARVDGVSQRRGMTFFTLVVTATHKEAVMATMRSTLVGQAA